MKRLAILLMGFCTLPFAVQAAEINAGFPTQSIWVSEANATAGEEIEIFTVVYNGTDATLKGAVAFMVDGERVSTEDFELAAGASNIVSTEWKATSGEHFVAAAIERASSSNLNDSITLSQKETASIAIFIAEPPPPPPLANAAAAASEVIADAARVATPLLTEAANTAYAFTESLRLDAIARLEKIVEGATQGSITPEVAGSSTSNSSGFTNAETKKPSGVSQVGQVAAAAALSALESRALFYPLLILFLFGLLYLLFRWATKRPRVR